LSEAIAQLPRAGDVGAALADAPTDPERFDRARAAAASRVEIAREALSAARKCARLVREGKPVERAQTELKDRFARAPELSVYLQAVIDATLGPPRSPAEARQAAERLFRGAVEAAEAVSLAWSRADSELSA
jgi:hypothetical protein